MTRRKPIVTPCFLNAVRYIVQLKMINYSKLTDPLLRCERCYESLNPSDLACIGSIVEYVAGNLCHQRIKVRNKSPSVNGRFLSRRFTYSKSKRSHWTDRLSGKSSPGLGSAKLPV